MVEPSEFSSLTRKFWRQALWFEKQAKIIRSSPILFDNIQWQAPLCETLMKLCELLGEEAQNEYERRISIRTMQYDSQLRKGS